MSIATKEQTMKLLRHFDLHAKQGYGQNFLIKPSIALAIAHHDLITSATVVIEIGPGLGALTEPLAARCHQVIAIEIDGAMVAVLQQAFATTPNVTIVHADFLKYKWQELFLSYPEHPFVVVSNLPYYLTSDILQQVVQAPLPVVGCLAMMQKEVAKRLLTREGGKAENELTLLTKFYADMEKVTEVSKNDFIPRPAVDSTVLAFRLKLAQKATPLGKTFASAVRLLFAARRKHLLNNVEPLFPSKADAQAWLEVVGIAPTVRAEALEFSQIVDLASRLTEEGYFNESE